jgi:uncharacterized Tic20 family protein
MTEPPRTAGNGAGDDDRIWALIAHFGGAIAMFVSGGTLGWLPPLIAYLVRGRESPTVRAHALAALNFQLFWSIIGALGWVLGICGSIFIIGAILLGVPVVATAFGVIFGIIAGVKAAKGEYYRYPVAPTIVK